MAKLPKHLQPQLEPVLAAFEDGGSVEQYREIHF